MEKNDVLIHYMVSKKLNSKKTDLPNINQPINIIIAGGTSMIGGFVDKFKEKLGDDFPIPVGEVKLAEDPLYTVSKGLYNASVVSEVESLNCSKDLEIDANCITYAKFTIAVGQFSPIRNSFINSIISCICLRCSVSNSASFWRYSVYCSTVII